MVTKINDNIFEGRNTIQDRIDIIKAYFMDMIYNSDNDNFELKIYFPDEWIIKETNLVTYTSIPTDDDTLDFNILRVVPNQKGVTIDDLVEWVYKNMKANQDIAMIREKFEEDLRIMQKKNIEEMKAKIALIESGDGFADEMVITKNKSITPQKTVVVEANDSSDIEDDEIIENDEFDDEPEISIILKK